MYTLLLLVSITRHTSPRECVTRHVRTFLPRPHRRQLIGQPPLTAPSHGIARPNG